MALYAIVKKKTGLPFMSSVFSRNVKVLSEQVEDGSEL